MRRAFVANRSVIVVHGPLFSTCSRSRYSDPNRGARRAVGPDPGRTHVPGADTRRSGRRARRARAYAATGRRSLVRIAPPDDARVPRARSSPSAGRPECVRARTTMSPTASAVAEAFRLAAERLGLRVVGAGAVGSEGERLPRAGEPSRASGADAVYFGGYVFSNGPRLIKDLREALGPDAELIGPDGFNQLRSDHRGRGAAAEGFAPMIAVLPSRELPPRDRISWRGSKSGSERAVLLLGPPAQAAHMMLDAIADSDGSRGAGAREPLKARVEEGYVGDFEIDRYGDTTLNTSAVYRIEDGGLRYKTAITPRRTAGAPLARRKRLPASTERHPALLPAGPKVVLVPAAPGGRRKRRRHASTQHHPHHRRPHGRVCRAGNAPRPPSRTCGVPDTRATGAGSGAASTRTCARPTPRMPPTRRGPRPSPVRICARPTPATRPGSGALRVEGPVRARR